VDTILRIRCGCVHCVQPYVRCLDNTKPFQELKCILNTYPLIVPVSFCPNLYP
jgi:hypothetical protein